LTQPSPCEELKSPPLCCPDCGETRIFTDIHSGEEVCTNCGLVINDPPVNYGKNGYSSNYENHEEQSRHGYFLTHSAYDRGFNTVIQGVKDVYGTKMGDREAIDMRRLQRRDNRSKVDDTVTRNLNVAMTELDRMTTTLHLPSTAKEYAAYVYRKALTADLVRGRSIDAFVAASVYMACRVMRIPRSLSTVANTSKREYLEVSTTYRLLLKELKIKPPIDDPQKYLSKLATMLGVPRQTECLAADILKAAKGSSAIMGKDPRGVAGAALYYAMEVRGEHLNQRIIAEASDTTAVTLRNRYRGLKKVLAKKSDWVY